MPECDLFKFRDKFYELVDGLTIGSPVSPPVANVFMEKFESRALELFEGAPEVWFSLIDDVFFDSEENTD